MKIYRFRIDKTTSHRPPVRHTLEQKYQIPPRPYQRTRLAGRLDEYYYLNLAEFKFTEISLILKISKYAKARTIQKRETDT